LAVDAIVADAHAGQDFGDAAATGVGFELSLK
jgi:hypothetical protein